MNRYSPLAQDDTCQSNEAEARSAGSVVDSSLASHELSSGWPLSEKADSGKAIWNPQATIMMSPRSPALPGAVKPTECSSPDTFRGIRPPYLVELLSSRGSMYGS